MERLWNEANLSFATPTLEEVNGLMALTSESSVGFCSYIKKNNVFKEDNISEIDYGDEVYSITTTNFSIQQHQYSHGSQAIKNSHCPPPSNVLCIGFDDILTTATARQGGADEFLWKELQNNSAITEASTAVCKRLHWRHRKRLDSCRAKQLKSDHDSEEANPNQIETTTCNDDTTGYTVDDQSGLNSNKAVTDYLNDIWPRILDSQSEVSTTTSGDTTSTTNLSSSVHSSGVDVGHSVASKKSSSSKPLSDADTICNYVSQLYGKTTLPTSTASLVSNIDYYTPLLGKRGRYYQDVWEESNYLESVQETTNNTSAMVRRLKSCDNWGHLLRNYSDNFDGAYRDWLMYRLDEKESQILEEVKARPVDSNNNESKKDSTVGAVVTTNRKKKPLDPIFRTATTSSTASQSNLSKVVELTDSDREALGLIIPPPVPVTRIHPASWGLRPAQHELLPYVSNNYSVIHPASVLACPSGSTTVAKLSSVSTTPIEQQQLPSKRISHRPVTLKHFDIPQPERKKRAVKENDTSAVVIPPANVFMPQQDVDNFDLLTEKLQHELEAVEAVNFCRLQRLYYLQSERTKLDKLMSKRKQLEDMLYRSVKKMEFKTSNHHVYSMKPPPPPSTVQSNGFKVPTVATLTLRSKSPFSSENSGHSGDTSHETRSSVDNGSVLNGVEKSTTHDIATNGVGGDSEDMVLPSSRSGYDSPVLGTTNNRPKCVIVEAATRTTPRSQARNKNAKSPNVNNNVHTNNNKHRREPNKYPMLGACLAHNVPHGEWLQSALSAEDVSDLLLEARDPRSDTWNVCRVISVRKDQNSLIRTVKVCPINGLPTSVQYISVEDGQLAPRGTNTKWSGHIEPDLRHGVTATDAAIGKVLNGHSND